MPKHLVHREGVCRWLHEEVMADDLSHMWYMDLRPIAEEGNAVMYVDVPSTWEPVLAHV